MRFSKFLIGQMLFISLLLINACQTDPIFIGGDLTDPTTQAGNSNEACPEDIVSFQGEILPLIVSSCAFSGCHDAATAEDDVILDNHENIFKEVKPGKPNDSELYESITEKDLDDIMPPPPHQPLSGDEIALIKTWIEQGAKNTTCGTPCDPALSDFSNTIYPMLKTYCVGCHSAASPQGNINLETYSNVLPYIQNGSLLGSMKHDNGYVAMPLNSPKVSDCIIQQIENWINEGAQNN